MIEISVGHRALLRTVGHKDSPPLVLLHAFGDSSHCYDFLLSSKLAETYRLIAVDLWGFGGSPARPDVQTFAQFSKALADLVGGLWTRQPIGLVGHSIAGSMAVEVASRLGDRVSGVFSIEGNLTPADAMFTGRACDFDDPRSFKEAFLTEIWELGQSSHALRHYYAGSCVGDAVTMWSLGRDAKFVSEGNRLGEAFQALSHPSLYYWSQASTPPETQDWISGSGIPNEIYQDAGHWPMVEQPQDTAESIDRFFQTVVK